MDGFLSRARAVLAMLVAFACAGASDAAAAAQAVTLNGLHYDLVSSRRAASVGSDGDMARARGTFVVLRLRVRNETRQDERAFLLQSYVTGRSGARYRVAHTATDVLSTNDPSVNTLQEVHPGSPISVVVAFDVAAQDRDLKLHIVAHYPAVGIERVMRLPY